MTETTLQQGKWECLTCGSTEGVISGLCPNCGPCQTNPKDAVAEEIAGVAEAAAEKESKEVPAGEGISQPVIEGEVIDEPVV